MTAAAQIKPVDEIKLSSIEEAISSIKRGEIIIVVDDEDRENEGDFICAAECVTPEIINFMATNGRGLICSPITEKRANELKLEMMVSENTDLHGTAFTVSIDYKLKGCSTGISAYDRATGIKALTEAETKSENYARPGHIFPLIAKSGGVLRRTGHTEAAVDLALLAGYYPAGVLVEILNEDGTMARLPQLAEIASRFNLKLISIKDLVAYRMQMESLIKRESSIEIDSPFGKFDLICYRETNTNLQHLVVKKGEWEKDEPVLTRVHASSNTGELFAILMKHTSTDFYRTLEKIAKDGKGALVLLRYEEEPGLMLHTINSLKEQQEKGEQLNPFMKRFLETEQKDIGIGSQIIHDLGIRKLKLLTNNPRKRVGLIGYGLEIVENIPI